MSSQEKEFLHPQSVGSQLGIAQGMKVADFGFGAGDFALLASKIVNETGLVSAIDIRESAISAFAARIKELGIKNIEIIRADLEVPGNTHLKNQSQDIVLIINMLFQSTQRDLVISEASRITKSNGSIVVIDWSSEDKKIGPPMELRVNQTDLKELFEKNGFSVERTIEAGHYHFGVVFKKNKS